MEKSFEEKVRDLRDRLSGAIADANKFDSGTGAAGTRVRVALLDTKKECDAIRKAISAEKNRRK